MLAAHFRGHSGGFSRGGYYAICFPYRYRRLMPRIIATSDEQASLRQHAQQRLSAGSAPPTRGWGVSVEALTLLHRLASAPDSAADALQLLHELQVHQVELDLQQAQLEASEGELTEELTRYRALFEQAPVAYFVLDARAQIEEANRAGAELLGIRAEELCGRAFGAFLTNDGQVQLASMVAALRRADANNAHCTVHFGNASGDRQSWQLSASAGPTSGAILLAATPGPASPESR